MRYETVNVKDLIERGAEVRLTYRTDGQEELPLAVYTLGGFSYWTIEGNAHCFGPFDSRMEAINNATERGEQK